MIPHHPQPQPQGSRPAPLSTAPQTVPAAAPSEPISPQAQPDIEPRRPQFIRLPLPVSTTDSMPGREVTAVLGPVIGTTTRPSDMAHSPEMAYINTRARQEALLAMVAQAQAAGADAVIGVHFDGGKISRTVSELCAYGTAVTLRRIRPH